MGRARVKAALPRVSALKTVSNSCVITMSDRLT